MSTERSSLGASVAVCLGSGITAEGLPSETTNLRAQAAIQLALAHPEMTIILSGDGRKTDDPALRSRMKTEAAVMADLLMAAGVAADRLLLEDESRDTIGNAILTVVRYLQNEKPRPLYIITSPFHEERALACFRGVLSTDWTISAYPCGIASEDQVRGANESGGLDWTAKFYAGITPGDITAAVQKLFAVGKDPYKQLDRLKAVVDKK